MTASRTTITDVEPLAQHWVRLTFADGAVHEIDLAGVLEAGGVFASIHDDRTIFEAVAVDPEFGTVMWPGDVDLDPDVLRGDQSPAREPSSPAGSSSPPEQQAARTTPRPISPHGAMLLHRDGRPLVARDSATARDL